MACNPADLTINPPAPIPAPNIGFGPIFAPPQIPFPDISLPTGVPEDILSLVQDIFILIPGGRLNPNADDAMRTVFSAVASILNQFAPFLALYNFFQALLEMVMCIIDVLCALLNPFAVASAVKRLLKRCIPNFLNLFPFTALIAMILAFIILLINIIEFLINYIIGIINDVIANINMMTQAFQLGDTEGALAIARKLASLLCLIEQAFAILVGLQAILAIIKALAMLAGRLPCAQGSGCCDDEFCPPFIRNSPNGISGRVGRMVYNPAIGQDVSDLPSGITLPGLRDERWQFVDDNYVEYPFKSIITPINGNIYWPQPNVFSKDDNLKYVVPYTCDLRMYIDPSDFDLSGIGPARHFRIKDTVVISQPYIGVLDGRNNPVTSGEFGNNDGTLKLEGGLVYEDDGETPVLSGGEQLTLNTFIHKPSKFSFIPPVNDHVTIEDISYVLKVNTAALMKYQLITAGCMPEVSQEAEMVRLTTPDIDAVINKVGTLDDLDINTTLDCLAEAMQRFRDNVSIEGAAIFQSDMEECLGSLKKVAEDTYFEAFLSGVSLFNSDISVSPEIQFINNEIVVSVSLKDSSGNIITNSIPESSVSKIENILIGSVTLGKISSFKYDGKSLFTAVISSDKTGVGGVSVQFNGGFLSVVENRDSDTLDTSISIISREYEFVGFDVSDDSAIRRDDTDVANG